MSSKEEIEAAIAAKGEEIRVLKAAKPPTLKDDLAPLVAELLALKVSFKDLTGEDFGGPKPEEKKKEKQVQEKKSDGPSKSELNKMKRKEQKAAKKAEERGNADVVTPVENAKANTGVEDVDEELAKLYGDYPLIQSAFMTDKAYRNIDELQDEPVGSKVWIRARVYTSRAVGKGIFILLRQSLNSVQAVMFQGSKVPKAMVKYACGLSLESVVDVLAEITVPNTPVQSATVQNLELLVTEIHQVSKAQELPFSIEDAGRNEDESNAAGLPTVKQNTRLNYRWVDTRTPANQAIFRIQSAVCQLFREYLISKNFIEIHSPKLIGGASEGGANVFKLDYFGQPACLAQSPQFYKQMAAACGGFERVFEIGPVFRAEDSNTPR